MSQKYKTGTFYALNFERLRGHIAFHESLLPSVCHALFYTSNIFGIVNKKADPYYFHVWRYLFANLIKIRQQCFQQNISKVSELEFSFLVY